MRKALLLALILCAVLLPAYAHYSVNETEEENEGSSSDSTDQENESTDEESEESRSNSSNSDSDITDDESDLDESRATRRRSKPTRRRSKPTRRRSSKPTRRRSSKPTRRRSSKPTRRRSSKPTRRRSSKSTHRRSKSMSSVNKAIADKFNPIKVMKRLTILLGMTLEAKINKVKDSVLKMLKKGKKMSWIAKMSIKTKLKKICKEVKKKGSKTLTMICNITQNALKKLPPNLFVQSLGGEAGVVVGGAERILDFKKNEVATCTVLGARAGTGYLAVAAEMGMGLGWKNKKINEGLKDVCDGKNAEFAVGVDLPFKFLGATMAAEVDLFESSKKPDWQGVVTVALIGSAGASALPTPVDVDFAITQGKYINGRKLSTTGMIAEIVKMGGGQPLLVTALLTIYLLNK